MARRQPYPFLKRDVSRHGQIRWYVRRTIDGVTHKTRLPDYPGASREAEAAYYEALKVSPIAKAVGEGRFQQESFGHIVGRYLSSSKYLALQPVTQEGYRRQFDALRRGDFGPIGSAPFKSFKRKHIVAIIEKKAATPGEGNNVLKALQALFTWAVKAGVLDVSPARDIGKMKIPEEKRRHSETWTEEHAALFRARWPLGTPRRTCFEIMWNTGLRVGDALRFGPQHIRDGRLNLVAHKNGEPINLRVLPELAEALAATPVRHLTYLATQGGRTRSAKAAYTWFSEAAREAGIPPRYTSHGCRKGLLTVLGDEGASDQQLMAVSGHTSARSLKPYLTKANKGRLADDAFALLPDERQHEDGTRMAHPLKKVGQND